MSSHEILHTSSVEVELVGIKRFLKGVLLTVFTHCHISCTPKVFFFPHIILEISRT